MAGISARALSFYLAGSPEDYYEFFIAARSPFHACIEPLVFGMMIAFAEKIVADKSRDFSFERARVIFFSGFGGIVCLMLSSEFMADIGWYDATLQPFLIALMMGLLVLGAVFGGAPCFLGARPLRFLARISYSLYLVHLPLWSFSFVLFQKAIGEDIALGLLPVFLMIFFAISILAAYALYMLVERPFLQIKDVLSKRAT
jgi:peptidoglycan/LPS O-acetylase OafA/YrhL